METPRTEGAARTSGVALEVGGSGPAAAMVESARSTIERRMAVFVGVWGVKLKQVYEYSDLLRKNLFVKRKCEGRLQM